MKIVKHIGRYLLTILLSIEIIVYLLIHIATSTILSKQYVLSQLKETDYYHQTYVSVQANFNNYVQQSGLEENVLQDIITQEKVEKDTKVILSNIYDGLQETISTQEIRDNLNKNIKESLGNVRLNAEQQQSIDDFVQMICDEYTSTIAHFKFEKSINTGYQKVMKGIDIVKKVFLIGIGVEIILLLVLCLKRIYKFFSFLGITAMATGMFYLLVNLFINEKIEVQYVVILNDAFSNTITNLLAQLLDKLFRIGLISTLLGFLLVIVSNVIHNIRKYKDKKQIAEEKEEEDEC